MGHTRQGVLHALARVQQLLAHLHMCVMPPSQHQAAEMLPRPKEKQLTLSCQLHSGHILGVYYGTLGKWPALYLPATGITTASMHR